MSTEVHASADGGIVFVINGVACPLDRAEAVTLVDRLVEKDAALASKLAGLLANERSEP